MFKYAVPALLLFLVITSLGCINLDFIKTQIPNLIINKNVEKKTADVLVIEDVKTLPKSPVFAGQSFRLYFTLKNKDPENPVENVQVTLYDMSSFGGSATPSECSSSCSISPGGEKTIYFDLIAPSSDAIANTATTGRVGLSVKYDFESKTKFEVAVINKQEVEKQQQAGKTLTLTPNTVMELGPVKIYPDLMGEDFLLADVDGSVRFTLKNEGTGMLEDNQIENGDFNLEFPSSFSPTGSVLEGNLFGKISDATGNAVGTGMEIGGGNGFDGTCSSDSDCRVTANIKHPKCREGGCIEKCGEKNCGVIDIVNCPPTDICVCTIGCQCGTANYCLQTTTTTISNSKTTTTRKSQSGATTTSVYVPIWDRVGSTKFFSCSGNSCSNIKEIELFDEESSPLLFRVSGYSVSSPFEIMEITATADYRYELRKSCDIDIYPIGIE